MSRSHLFDRIKVGACGTWLDPSDTVEFNAPKHPKLPKDLLYCGIPLPVIYAGIAMGELGYLMGQHHPPGNITGRMKMQQQGYELFMLFGDTAEKILAHYIDKTWDANAMVAVEQQMRSVAQQVFNQIGG